jgi:chemotaxis protein CheD
MDIVLSIGEYAISNRTGDFISTHALGSCVALVIYQPTKRILAMAHVALPDSAINPEAAKRRPGYYADTAVKTILDAFAKEFSSQNWELHARLYGGADAVRKTDLFTIGKRNLSALEKASDNHGLLCQRRETGGAWSRTIKADVVTGRVEIQSFPFVY